MNSNAVCRRAGLAILPDGFAVGLEQRRRAGLFQRDVDRAETASSIRAEGLQVHARINDSDNHGDADCGGSGFGRDDDGAGLR